MTDVDIIVSGLLPSDHEIIRFCHPERRSSAYAQLLMNSAYRHKDQLKSFPEMIRVVFDENSNQYSVYIICKENSPYNGEMK